MPARADLRLPGRGGCNRTRRLLHIPVEVKHESDVFDAGCGGLVRRDCRL